MSGTVWVGIVTPIIALLCLGTWLGMVYWADAHPALRVHGGAPEPEARETGSLTTSQQAALTESAGVSASATAGAHDDSEFVPSPSAGRVV